MADHVLGTGIVERVQDGGGSSRFAACVEKGYF